MPFGTRRFVTTNSNIQTNDTLHTKACKVSNLFCVRSRNDSECISADQLFSYNSCYQDDTLSLPPDYCEIVKTKSSDNPNNNNNNKNLI
jgi:hypothetical protein